MHIGLGEDTGTDTGTGTGTGTPPTPPTPPLPDKVIIHESRPVVLEVPYTTDWRTGTPWYVWVFLGIGAVMLLRGRS